jgi:hypothetical protein
MLSTEVAPSNDTDAIELLRSSDIVVRLKVKRVASLADTSWLCIEFENLSSSDFRIRSLYCTIEREDYSTTTGDMLCSGDVFSGNSIDLFPYYFDSTHPAQIFIQPGLYETCQYLSDHTATLLGLPPEDTIAVRAVVHMKVNWQHAERISTPPDGVEFDFLWIYPDSAGFEAMRERMRYLLVHPLRVQHSIIERTLMSIPEVADAIPTVEILDRLTVGFPYFVLSELRDPWRTRPNLMAYIDSCRANDPIVLDHIGRKIDSGYLVSSLCRYGRNLWSERFVEPVLDAYESSRSPYCLTYMWEHRDQWPEEQSIASRLSALVLQRRSLSKTLSENSTKNEILTVAYTLEEFGYTCDTTILPLIQPYLDDTTQAFDITKYFNHGVQSPARPSRICDKALEAVLRILGIDPSHAYSEAINGSDFSEPVTTDSLSRVLRNQMIVDIKEQLSQAVR